MEGSSEKNFNDAAEQYLRDFYRNIGEIHYSLPSGLHLEQDELEMLIQGKNEDLPADYAAKTKLFYRVKSFCGSAPSLLIADYKFSKTFYEAFEEELSKKGDEGKKELRKKLCIPDSDTLTTGSHGIFLSYPGHKNVYNIFFQVGAASFEENEKNVKKKIRRAVDLCEDDKCVFRTMCGPFLHPNAITLALPAFPFIERKQLRDALTCVECSQKILTRDDIQNHDALRKFLKTNGVNEFPARIADKQVETENVLNKIFYDISSLYLCASSSIEVRRSHSDHSQVCDVQMEKTLCILTPMQKSLAYEYEISSWILLISGGSGTGKTIVLKERALALASRNPMDEVLVINLAGGHLTKYFLLEFKGELRSYYLSTKRGASLKRKRFILYYEPCLARISEFHVSVISWNLEDLQFIFL